MGAGARTDPPLPDSAGAVPAGGWQSPRGEPTASRPGRRAHAHGPPATARPVPPQPCLAALRGLQTGRPACRSAGARPHSPSRGRGAGDQDWTEGLFEDAGEQEGRTLGFLWKRLRQWEEPLVGPPTPLCSCPPPPQGFVESMKMILGGSMARVGALSECPFQGDESIHSAGNTETSVG